MKKTQITGKGGDFGQEKLKVEVALEPDVVKTLTANLESGYVRHYYVVREHNNEQPVVLDAELVDGKLIFASEKFSTFHVLYKDVMNPACSINGVEYPTLQAAIASVTDGTPTTITLLRNIDDAIGISVNSNKNITIDFANHVYTVGDPGAGSPGTETSAFQLLKDSTLTFKNGTLKVAENPRTIKRVFQSYANVTFENFTIDAINLKQEYPLSFNCGNVVFKGDSNIYTNAKEVFDACYWSSGGYTAGVSVTFDDTFTGEVQGTIVYDSADEAKGALTIQGSGSFGGITVTSGSTNNPNIDVESGKFNEDVTSYVVPGKMSLGINGAYYVGDSKEVQPAIDNAQGTIEVLAGEGELVVPSGVTVKNNTANEIIVNGKPLKAGETVNIEKPAPACKGPKDKNCDGVVTCEEEMGKGWTWNNSKKVCEYTGSYVVVNTAAK